jgi:hypothetical protein
MDYVFGAWNLREREREREKDRGRENVEKTVGAFALDVAEN